MKKAGVVFILVCGITHVYLGLGPIRLFAPTYDEPVHLTAGFSYWKTGNYRMNGHDHPALAEMWAAIPLLFSKATLPFRHPSWVRQSWFPREQYHFAHWFVDRNALPMETILARGRMMMLAFSALFMVAVGLYLLRHYGVWVGTVFSAFWGFSPSILAHATLVTTDLFFAAFFFLFFLLMSSEKKAVFIQGTVLALCYASKFSALVVLPIFIFVRAIELRRSPFSLDELKQFLKILLVAAGVLALLYIVKELPVYFSGLSKIIGRSQEGRSSFLCGRHRTEGWWWYFPFALAVKSTPAEGVALVLSCVGWLRSKNRRLALMYIPPILFFLLACFSRVQIGHRHILLVYPFLFWAAGRAITDLSPSIRWICASVILFLMLGTFSVRPYFLSYFNGLVGGSASGYRFLSDSNVDWGQSLKELALQLSPEEKKNGIFLSYFGVADPHSYGIRYWDVGSDDIVGHVDDSQSGGLQPTTLAISATNIQATYYADKDIFSWLKKIRPTTVIGHSIFVYDFRDHPEILAELNEMRKPSARP